MSANFGTVRSPHPFLVIRQHRAELRTWRSFSAFDDKRPARAFDQRAQHREPACPRRASMRASDVTRNRTIPLAAASTRIALPAGASRERFLDGEMENAPSRLPVAGDASLRIDLARKELCPWSPPAIRAWRSANAVASPRSQAGACRALDGALLFVSRRLVICFARRAAPSRRGRAHEPQRQRAALARRERSRPRACREPSRSTASLARVAASGRHCERAAHRRRQRGSRAVCVEGIGKKPQSRSRGARRGEHRTLAVDDQPPPPTARCASRHRAFRGRPRAAERRTAPPSAARASSAPTPAPRRRSGAISAAARPARESGASPDRRYTTSQPTSAAKHHAADERGAARPLEPRAHARSRDSRRRSPPAAASGASSTSDASIRNGRPRSAASPALATARAASHRRSPAPRRANARSGGTAATTSVREIEGQRVPWRCAWRSKASNSLCSA